jgi:hypothetical protein
VGFVRRPDLPPQHPPGRQTGRREMRNLASFATLLVTGCILAGMAAWVYGVGESSGNERYTVAGFIGVFAIAAFAGAGYVWAKARPRLPRGLGVDAHPRVVEPGQAIEVTLALSRPPAAGERIDVGLVCTQYWDAKARTRGDAFTLPMTIRETLHRELWQEWKPVESARDGQVVRLEVPSNARYSWEGDALSVLWSVAIRRKEGPELSPPAHQGLWVLQ